MANVHRLKKDIITYVLHRQRYIITNLWTTLSRVSSTGAQKLTPQILITAHHLSIIRYINPIVLLRIAARESQLNSRRQ